MAACRYVCTYILDILLIVSWRFTILLLGEIDRQLVKAPVAAAISPHLISPAQLIHEMLDETRDRPPQRELRLLLFSTSVWAL